MSRFISPGSLLLAGFRSVIATMWDGNNERCIGLPENIYEYLFYFEHSNSKGNRG